MKNFEIEKLLVNVSQIIAMMKGVNINKDSITVHAAAIKVVRNKLDKWQSQYQNEEERKKLSLPEQQTLMTNAQNFWQVHEELRKELDYLDMTKQPSNVANALNELTYAYLLLEWLSDFVGKSGRTILPHLTSLRANTFDGGKYKNQIDSLYSEVEAQGHDFYVDHVVLKDLVDNIEICRANREPMLIPICDHLTVAACWLGKEKERLVTEALPELKVIKLPEEIKPEVPVAPEKELKN